MTGATAWGDALGRWGLFLPAALDAIPPVGAQLDTVRALEDAGCPTAWVNEGVGGKDALVQLALLLDATDRMVFGTGVANMWARPAQTMHAAAAMLAQAHPGRLVLGIGVGHPAHAAAVGRELARPVATLRDYLTAMDAPTQAPTLDGRYPRILGANGPAMLRLAAEAADGAFPAMQPTDATAEARRVLGPGQLLVVMQRLDLDPATTAATRATVEAHLAAGADHVALGLPLGTAFAAGAERVVDVARSFAADQPG